MVAVASDHECCLCGSGQPVSPRLAHIGTGEDWAQPSNPAQDGPEQSWRNSRLGHLKPDIPCLVANDLDLNLVSDQCLTLWASASRPRKLPQLYIEAGYFGLATLRWR